MRSSLSLGGRACCSASGEQLFLAYAIQEDGNMLVLTRKCGEAFVIAEANIVITLLEMHGNRARIGVEAPAEVMVYRREVWERIRKQGRDANVECASPPAPARAADAHP